MFKKILAVVLIITVASCNGNKDREVTPTSGTEITSSHPSIPPPQPIIFTIDAVYPHDTSSFTEGLQFYNGKLYEGTGMNGKSYLRITDPVTGKIEKQYHYPDEKIFGEGVQVFGDKIYQLTWENHKIFVFNKDDISKPIKTLEWKRQGWGMTNDGRSLIISDGTANLYYLQPDSMRIMKIISVQDNNGPVDSLNELEYINGYIYANVWQKDIILKIDPESGHVVGKMDLTNLLQQYAPKDIVYNHTDVLNGIAYDSTTKKIYITGKYWPKMFRMTLNNQ